MQSLLLMTFIHLVLRTNIYISPIYLYLYISIDGSCLVFWFPLINLLYCSVQSFSCVFFFFDKVEYRFMICRDLVIFLYLSEVHCTQSYSEHVLSKFSWHIPLPGKYLSPPGSILFVRISREGDLLMLLGDS